MLNILIQFTKYKLLLYCLILLILQHLLYSYGKNSSLEKLSDFPTISRLAYAGLESRSFDSKKLSISN